jgi:hypothetical protein
MPLITDVFGTDSFVLSTDQTVAATTLNPVLVIPASGLTTWNDKTQIQNPNKWLTAIARNAQDFFADKLNDGTLALTVAPTYLSLAERVISGNSVTKTWYQIGINCYTPFTGPQFVDPDDVA